jgi:hypothetical protein
MAMIHDHPAPFDGTARESDFDSAEPSVLASSQRTPAAVVKDWTRPRRFVMACV